MKKGILFLVIVSFIVLLFSTNLVKEAEPELSEDERLSKVMDNAWDNYDMFASVVDDENSEVFFDIDQIDQHKFIANMENKLKEYDLSDKYSISIKRSNAKELELQQFKEDMKSYVSDYIQENGYEGVEFEANYEGKKPRFTFYVAEDANVSKEELEKEIHSLLQFKGK
ncbi:MULTISPECIES: hypothetical protein [Clostridia]|uniref:hypothetical protein n=1 Tax=Clostridia TaxID=186801 RepID=UPI000EA2A406|nr:MULTISPECIES: hypothetical protein [Clostridia]NBJ69387.1 hypothetical protein [Roseburia sp. 1XD42-34]RKI78785.1 hypothetical protein D7V87_07870 [Clostridium sp. 1xD42-85]